VALIYRVDNREAGLTYVGQTILPLEDRWKAHVAYAWWVIKHLPEKDTHFARAIRKHGHEAFAPSIVEEVPDELLNEREIHWIAALGTFEEGYNSTRGGGGRLGVTLTEETKEKIRRAATGRKMSPEAVEKMAASKRGMKQSDEVVAKRAAAIRAAGHHRSDDVKEKIRASNIGQTRSLETRAKISASAQGRMLSEKTKKKLGKPVRQLTKDGELIQMFDTLTEAGRATGYSKGAVCNNLRDPKRWPLKDTIFEYVTT